MTIFVRSTKRADNVSAINVAKPKLIASEALGNITTSVNIKIQPVNIPMKVPFISVIVALTKPAFNMNIPKMPPMTGKNINTPLKVGPTTVANDVMMNIKVAPQTICK